MSGFLLIMRLLPGYASSQLKPGQEKKLSALEDGDSWVPWVRGNDEMEKTDLSSVLSSWNGDGKNWGRE